MPLYQPYNRVIIRDRLLKGAFMLHRSIMTVYAFLLSLLFSTMLIANITSFLGIYTPTLVLTATFATTLASFGLYQWAGKEWKQNSFNPPSTPRNQQSLAWSVIIACILVIGMIFVVRMMMYPYSSLGDNISGDLIGYHGVKAIELVRTGTLWDLDMPYGQYPIGYESLLSSSYLIGQNFHLAGLWQAISLITFQLTVYLLFIRYTTLPNWIAFAVSTALLFIPNFYGLFLLIGKNDLLLAISVLGLLLHTPLGMTSNDKSHHIIGMAYMTMISLSTKASAFPILFLLWIIFLWRWWEAYRNKTWKEYANPFIFVLCIVLMFPSGLWVIRNYIMMQELFSPEISSFFIGSIANNLTNPDLYQSGQESIDLIVFVIIQVFFMGWILFSKTLSKWHSLILFVMFVTFAITPLSAFHTPERHTLNLEWRYTLHTFYYNIVLLVVLLSPVILHIISKTQSIKVPNLVWRVCPLLPVLGSIFAFGVLSAQNFWAVDIERDWVFSETQAYTIGDDIYVSIYEYTRENIQDSVIVYSVGEHLFLYDDDLTNQISAGNRYPLGLAEVVDDPIPDYMVHASLEADPFDFLPEYDVYDWEIIYEDATGQIFKRIDS